MSLIIDEAERHIAAGRTAEGVRRLEYVLKTYCNPDQYGQAELVARRLCDLKPNDAQTWSTLGAVLRKLRRLDEARRAQEHALSVDPGFSKALIELSKIERDEVRLGTRECAQSTPQSVSGGGRTREDARRQESSQSDPGDAPDEREQGSVADARKPTFLESLLHRPAISPRSAQQRPPAFVEYLWNACRVFILGLLYAGLAAYFGLLAYRRHWESLWTIPAVLLALGAADHILLDVPAIFLWALRDHATHATWRRQKDSEDGAP